MVLRKFPSTIIQSHSSDRAFILDLIRNPDRKEFNRLSPQTILSHIHQYEFLNVFTHTLYTDHGLWAPILVLPIRRVTHLHPCDQFDSDQCDLSSDIPVSRDHMDFRDAIRVRVLFQYCYVYPVH